MPDPSPLQMTPREIVAARDALVKRIGGRAQIYINISLHGQSKPLHATVYLDGLANNDRRFGAEADEWPEMFDSLLGTWREYEGKYTAETIRKMALEIIRVTADRGQCTEADLRIADFTDTQIANLSERAIADANTIAANGPFSLIRKAGNGVLADVTRGGE